MMNLILALVASAGISTAYAQNDGYHIEPVTTCGADDTCLISSDQSVIKWIAVESYDRRHFDFELSSKPALSDRIHQRSQDCFSGEVERVCPMFKRMAHYENTEYYAGGHSRVISLSCTANTADEIQLYFEVHHDMGRPQIQSTSKTISRCSN